MSSLKDIFGKKKKENTDNTNVCIDCRECDATFDISEERCLRCCSGRIADSEGDVITFITSTEIQYRGDAARLIRNLVGAVSGTCSILADDRRGCARCPFSKSHFTEAIWSDISIININDLLDRYGSIPSACESSDICRKSAVASLTALRNSLNEMADDVRTAANRIVGA